MTSLRDNVRLTIKQTLSRAQHICADVFHFGSLVLSSQYVQPPSTIKMSQHCKSVPPSPNIPHTPSWAPSLQSTCIITPIQSDPNFIRPSNNSRKSLVASVQPISNEEQDNQSDKPDSTPPSSTQKKSKKALLAPPLAQLHCNQTARLSLMPP